MECKDHNALAGRARRRGDYSEDSDDVEDFIEVRELIEGQGSQMPRGVEHKVNAVIESQWNERNRGFR